MAEKHRPASARREQVRKTLPTEEGERGAWRTAGWPGTLRTAEVKRGRGRSIRLAVVESDRGKNKRQRRVVLGTYSLHHEVTANQAQDLSDVLSEAAQHVRRGKTHGELAAEGEAS